MIDPEASCTEVIARVFAFLDGELDDQSCDEIRIHLMACEECLDYVDAETQLRVLIKKACCCSAPAALAQRIAALRHKN
ncbi:MAG: mycothiol system anti-sigma-R factor [Propionibacteriaceae bacterium]